MTNVHLTDRGGGNRPMKRKQTIGQEMDRQEGNIPTGRQQTDGQVLNKPTFSKTVKDIQTQEQVNGNRQDVEEGCKLINRKRPIDRKSADDDRMRKSTTGPKKRAYNEQRYIEETQGIAGTYKERKKSDNLHFLICKLLLTFPC